MKRIIKLISVCFLSVMVLSMMSCKGTPNEGVPSPTFGLETKLLFVNVGKGDSMIIAFGEHAYLVDTGEKEAAPQVIGALRTLGIKSLDGVFLTHTHSDHVGGMETISQYIDIGTIYCSEFTELTKKGENRYEKMSEKLSIPLTVLKAGDILDMDGVVAEVLAPTALNTEDDNDNSLVIMLTINSKKVLLTGDMQFTEEGLLLATNKNLSADLLKVGNHGNPDATSERFALAVSPKHAIISTDTTVDTDSANARVKTALGDADICVTEDFSLGILFTFGTDGSISYSEALPNNKTAQLSITKIDKSAQTISIRNDGDSCDISGYMIYSDKGGELFIFPEGSMLGAGEVVTVSCEGGGGDYIWAGEKSVWHDKKTDIGILFDPFGTELMRYVGE